MIVGVASPCTGDTKRSIHLVPEFLQHPHELIIHFKDSASTTAGDFRLAEVAMKMKTQSNFSDPEYYKGMKDRVEIEVPDILKKDGEFFC